MKYKYSGKIGFENVGDEILARRGIADPKHYRDTSEKDILPHSLLGNSIEKAFDILELAAEKEFGIGILCDADADGNFSASMLYSYLNKVYDANIFYYFHAGKEHGLTNKELFPKILEDVNSGKLRLLFVPDAGSNDAKECEILENLGCKVIILDHHEISNPNPFAIIVNPQLVDGYPNLSSSGTLITWKFMKAIDENKWLSLADRYLDMVACSIISDNMDISKIENRAIIEIGLSNINNGFLSEFILKDFRIKENPPTVTEIAFYLNPALNGMVRSGTPEEKELVFRALCEIDEEFDYTKRDKTQIKETIYQRAIRFCTNAKSRQDRAVVKGMELVEEDIEKFKRNDNKILFALADESIDKSFSGLVAMKLASKYNKPCVLLRQKDDYFSGSIRNFNDSPLTDLKGFLKSLGYVAWIQGHANAAGIGLSKKQLEKTIILSNEKLKGYDFSPEHLIDFEFDYSDLSELREILLPLYSLRHYYGQGLSETKILIKNVKVNSSKISFFGARENSDKKNNWKFELTEGIDVLNFRADDEDYIYKQFANNDGSAWDGVDVFMDVVVKVGRTEYNGESRWCMIVEEYEVNNG